jgi:hypothetical protein
MDGSGRDTRDVTSATRVSAKGDQEAEQCNSWQDFKLWANKIRAERDVESFRGHGNSDFSLRTTLHRAGRYRLERYLAEDIVYV